MMKSATNETREAYGIYNWRRDGDKDDDDDDDNVDGGYFGQPGASCWDPFCAMCGFLGNSLGARGWAFGGPHRGPICLVGTVVDVPGTYAKPNNFVSRLSPRFGLGDT